MSAEQRLVSLGLTLPPPPTPLGNYVPFRLAGNLLFLSGVGPRAADGSSIVGKVGAEVDVERGYEAAKLCGLNLLVNIRSAAGSLDRVDTVLKVLGMVNAVPSFTDHSQGDRRLHRPVRRGVRRGRPAGTLGGRHGQPAERTSRWRSRLWCCCRKRSTPRPRPVMAAQSWPSSHGRPVMAVRLWRPGHGGQVMPIEPGAL